MASVRVPILSSEATEFLNSIVPQHTDMIETDSLTQGQIEELLTVLETELEMTSDAERTRDLGEFAAALIRLRKV